MRGTCLARVQVNGLRDRLLKIGARVVKTMRRIVLSCPKAYPSVLALGVIVRRLRPLRS